MVYGRQVGDKTLNFEASGALLDASLVMRDRETDSWWSIMTSDSIGGDLDGEDLRQLPVGEKVQFGEWKNRHPETKVLSVKGAEHVENNPYDNYFNSAGTFRDQELTDKRLDAKEHVYTFHAGDVPVAVPHSAFMGGAVFEHEAFGGRALLLARSEDDSFYKSSSAYFVPVEVWKVTQEAEAILGLYESRLEPIGGFDTFWYTWVAVNEKTILLK